MAVTLTYEPTLSRVKIAATGLGAALVATVERSTDQASWTTVRGASAATVAGSAIAAPLYDYEFAPSVINYYRVTAVPAGLYLPGTAGNYASTPDTAALDIVGDIDLRADATLADWTPAVAGALIGKWLSTGNQLSYALVVGTDGKLGMWWSANGSTGVFSSSTVAVTPTSSGRLTSRATVDVDNGAAGRTVTYYTAPTMSGSWTQLGAPVITAGTTSIFASTAILEAGSTQAGAGDRTIGVIHAIEVRNGIAGTAVANPQFDAQDHLDTSFVDAAGRTWTVNGTANILTSQTASITPGDAVDCSETAIWLKNISRPFLNRPVEVINRGVIAITRPARVGIFDIVGRTYPVAVSDMRKSRRWTMTVRTYTDPDAAVMELLLASGDVLFIQTPPNCSVPGGYVAVGDIERAAHPLRPNRVTWTLPCTEVAAPGPDVVGTAVTWQTVIDTYASWTAEMAAKATWADLLTLLGSPTEVIVP